MDVPVRTASEAAETEYWAHLYGRWEPFDIAGVAAFMAGFTRPWWVVGGWAIDAFTGEHRPHDDVDVSILACDVPALREHAGDRWHLWNLAGGDMRPLTQTWLRQALRSTYANHPWLGLLDKQVRGESSGG